MIPVQQTKFGYPGGNCLAACLASIFEVDIDSVPDFGDGSGWYDKFEQYMMEAHDLQPIDIEYPSCHTPIGYHIINGESPRGDYLHAVVGKDGEPVFDPHPDDTEVVKITSLTLFLKVIK